MKLRNIIAFISFAAFTSLVSSCGDDYMPITLVSEDGETTYNNNDTISIAKFSDGESFNIKGGDGFYAVKVTDNKNGEKDIIDYSQKDNSLTFLPKEEGFCRLSIRDGEKNETRIVVEVEKIDKLYTIESHDITIEGYDAFTDGERKNIKDDILNNALVKVGGKLEFKYSNPNGGIVEIKKTEHSENITTTFTQEEIFDKQTGNKILLMTISLPTITGPTMVLTLSEKDLTLTEDLTNKYKPGHPNLKNATLKYKLSILTDKKDNDK